LLSYATMGKVLERLFWSRSKPRYITPTDLSVAAYIVSRRVFDHELYDSALTIAERLGIDDPETVGESLTRLENAGWISCRNRGRGRTKGISIRLENFPAAEPVQSKITPEAKDIVKRYRKALEKYRLRKRRFDKSWDERQLTSAQWMLGECNGDAELVAKMIAVALHEKATKATAAKSLYELRQIWPKVIGFYHAWKAQLQATAKAPVQPPLQVEAPPPEKQPQPVEPSNQQITQATNPKTDASLTFEEAVEMLMRKNNNLTFSDGKYFNIAGREITDTTLTLYREMAKLQLQPYLKGGSNECSRAA